LGPAKFEFRGGYPAAKFAAKHKSSKYARAFSLAADISVATARRGAYSLPLGASSSASRIPG
jgi:hypothetical protein